MSVEQIVRKFKDSGYLISPEAIKLIMGSTDVDNVIEVVLKYLDSISPKPVVVNVSHISNALTLSGSKDKKMIIRELKTWHVDFEIKFTFTGYKVDRSMKLIDGYSRLLIDRYQKLKRILLERPDMRYAVPLKDIKKSVKRFFENESSQQRKTATYGLVLSVTRNSKKVEIVLEDITIEDKESGTVNRIIAEVPSSSQAFKKAAWIAENEVIGLVGVLNNDKFEVDDILLPGITLKPIRRPNDDFYVAFLSDLHVGSLKFVENRFKTFINTVQGNTDDPKLRNIIKKLRFIIIAGDLVDGFGVYKDQEKELLTMNVDEQYKMLAELLSGIPEDITIFLIPGEHDVSGLYAPSPPIPREFAQKLYSMKNVRMLGDPSFIRIAGVDILVSHGRGLDDAVELYTLKGFTSEGIIDAMESLLLRRNLIIPINSKVIVAPYPHDFNVITVMPDIMHMGHVHIAAAAKLYKNILLINSGSWQEQSIKQKMKGLNPSVGTCYFVNLKDMTLLKAVF
ncbi:MAG: metallophosphoesterase [Thermoprotei archaeon]